MYFTLKLIFKCKLVINYIITFHVLFTLNGPLMRFSEIKSFVKKITIFLSKFLKGFQNNFLRQYILSHIVLFEQNF